MTNKLKNFRFINKVEGYSFLVLLFIAMPLKLFNEKSIGKIDAVKFFVLSLVPFGSFMTESILKKRTI